MATEAIYWEGRLNAPWSPTKRWIVMPGTWIIRMTPCPYLCVVGGGRVAVTKKDIVQPIRNNSVGVHQRPASMGTSPFLECPIASRIVGIANANSSFIADDSAPITQCHAKPLISYIRPRRHAGWNPLNAPNSLENSLEIVFFCLAPQQHIEALVHVRQAIGNRLGGACTTCTCRMVGVVKHSGVD